jgi:glycosyltransferase involved in cell wall biosynthesis
MPAISVILAVHNTERYVAAAVNSILAQTLRDFELILIDDGSTDRSSQICKQLADGDSRIRLISQSNRGLTKSLNEGIASATSPLIARMDADDLSLPERFEKQVAYMNAHPECICLGSRVTLIDEYDSPIRESDHKLTHEEIDAELLKGIGWAIVHPAAMMRADALRAIGGYDEQYRTAQDLDLFLRLAEHGKLANLPEPLVQYRQHLESVNFAKAQQQANLKEQIVQAACKRRGLPAPDFSKLVHAPQLPRSEQRRRWAWIALKRGNAPVARKHAWAALTGAPFSVESWRVMYCALRGH